MQQDMLKEKQVPELKVENLVVRYDTEDAVVHAVNDVSF